MTKLRWYLEGKPFRRIQGASNAYVSYNCAAERNKGERLP